MKAFLFTLLVMLLLNSSAFAQAQGSVQSVGPTMVVTGAVYDINGAVIVDGTKIIAYDVNGKKYEASTNGEGIYKIQLPFAVYRIEVSAPGFCSAQIERYVVVNSTYGKMSLDFALEVANPQEGCKHESVLEKKSKRRTKKKPEIILE